jgi:hypothetical protein
VSLSLSLSIYIYIYNEKLREKPGHFNKTSNKNQGTKVQVFKPQEQIIIILKTNEKKRGYNLLFYV